MKLFTRLALIVAAGSLLYACSSNQSGNTPAADSHLTKDTALTADPELSRKAAIKDRQFNDVARFLAGMEQEEGSSIKAYEKMKPWVSYHKRADSIWKKLSNNKLAKMRALSDADFKHINQDRPFVFYPFSGPDFLNAFTFFPQAKGMVMIGLENPGTVPALEQFSTDSFQNMIGQIDKSLNAIIRFSFFRTISMASDLKSKQLDGTLPLAMIFVVRTGNTIGNIEYIHVDAAGAVKEGRSKEAFATNGYRISYLAADNMTTGEMLYFGTDLSDVALPKNTGFLAFLKGFEPGYTTYLKAASFLMHKDYFSTVRSLILKNSKYVLQDDSGIPVRFFVNGGWDIKLYGTYDKPISLFANWYQKDMKKLYDSLEVKPLNFGIGYDWRQNESNLMLFTRP